MLPLTFPGIYVLAVTRSRRIRQLGWFWLVPGILYTFCLHCTSNTGFYAISSAGAISSSAGLVLMGMYCRELQEENHRTAREGRILTALLRRGADLLRFPDAIRDPAAVPDRVSGAGAHGV